MLKFVENPPLCISLLRDQLKAAFDVRDWAVQRDDAGSDERIWFAERVSPEFSELRAWMISRYENVVNREFAYGFLMANRTTATIGNLGSGGGWHRDSWRGQHKVFCYLSGVSSETGGFEYVPGSNRLIPKMVDYATSRGSLRDSKENQSSRIIEGEAGTCFVADTTLLHRGRPLLSGERYAVTLYGLQKGDPRIQKFTRKFEALKSI